MINEIFTIIEIIRRTIFLANNIFKIFNTQSIAEKFLAGDMEVDEFLEQFLSRRKLMHLRKVKVDKLKELIKKTHFSAGGLGYPVTSNFPGIVPSIPYPTGPMSMPMPVPPGLSHYRPY